MASVKKTAASALLLAAIGCGGFLAGRDTAPVPPEVTPTIITKVISVTPEPTPQKTAKPASTKSRKSESETTREYRYVASRKSDKFHKLQCSYAANINKENRVYFETRNDAIAAGKDPCSRCKP